MGLGWRADVYEGLLSFEVSKISPRLNLSGRDDIIIGSEKIAFSRGDLVVVQEERVIRDWLSSQMRQNPFDGEPLTVFLEKHYYTKEELREDIGWHEGGRLAELIKEGVRYKPAVGTIAAYDGTDWYAPDEKGEFRFSISIDKIYYPTTRFLSKDMAVVIDTHGINMLVLEALESKADAVIGCCDYPGKIKAAIYLAERGIDVLCFTDRFLYMALGHETKGAILGSPFFDEGVYGGRETVLERGQKIVVTNIQEGKEYPYQYYDTPYRYFSEINKTFPLEIYDFKVTDYNQTKGVFELAEKKNARLVGFRVFDSYDYGVAKEWLMKSGENKIVLFHSTPYPYGVLLAREFPEQVGSNDNVIG
jgi:hypothetical protein